MINQKAPSIKVVHAFLPLIVISGLIQLLIPSTIKMIMKHFDIVAGEAGILPMMYFAGMLMATISVTHLIKKYTVKQIIITGAILCSISLLLASQITNFPLFASTYIIIGFGNGLVMILPGIYSTHIFGSKSAQLQSLIFAFMAIGFIIGPVFPGLISYFNLSWRWCFAFPGIIILPMVIPVILSEHEPIDHAEKLTLKITKSIFNLDRRFFIGIILITSIGAGSSSALLTWLITFLENNRGSDIGMAHIILSIMGVASFAGRRIWGRVASKKRVYKTLLFISPMAMIFVFIAPQPSSIYTNIVLFAFAVIFISGINPLALSAAAIYPKSYGSSAYTILFSSAAIGGMAIPFGIGLVFQQTNSIIGMSSISLLIMIIVLSLLYIRREMPLSEHIHRHLMP